MTLDDLARSAPYARSLAVPAWTLGCFHRRSITYANGQEDQATAVIWIQSHGLTGDLRIPAARPTVGGRTSLGDCAPAELAELAKGEGGVADTAFADGRMSWSNWAAFQPYDKWPEPGDLRRVGPALIEFAPSGAYVEDWRSQPRSAGLLVGLRLLTEALPGGRAAPRDGGLVIAGDHAILALARRQSLPDESPVFRQIAAAQDPRALAALAFDAEAHYATLTAAGDYRVALSIDPFAQGRRLDLDGFARSSEAELVQTLDDGRRRLWRIDTLLAGVSVPRSTPMDGAADGWLAREAETLLAAATT